MKRRDFIVGAGAGGLMLPRAAHALWPQLTPILLNNPIIPPNRIPGLILWLDASQRIFSDAGTTPATNGGTIQQWNDLSSAGNNASQATLADRPLYETGIVNGLPVARFNGTSDFLNASTLAANKQAFSIFIVSRVTDVTSLKLYANMSGSFQLRNDQYASPRASLEFVPDGSTNMDAALFPPLNTWFIQALCARNGLVQYRMNGLSSAIIGQASAAISNLFIGSFSNGAFNLAGDIAAVIAYGSLTDSQIASVEKYLSHRYNIALTTSSAIKQVVFQSNSLGFGNTTSNPPSTGVCGVMATALGSSWKVWNYGVPSQTTSQMNGGAGTHDAASQVVDPKFSYPGTYSKNICIGWEITNELFNGVAEATAYSNYVTYCQARQAAGWKVIAATVLPRSGASTPAGFETDRQTVNTSIRNNWATFADGLADVASDANIGQAGDSANLTYYSSDQTHLNDTGVGVAAPYFTNAVLAL